MFNGTYSFASRIEECAGINPEEQSAVAHAGCFAMALSLLLGQAGIKRDYFDVTAQVTIIQQGGAFKIIKGPLICEAKRLEIEQATFVQHAESAKANCPVSQALAGIGVTLKATIAVR